MAAAVHMTRSVSIRLVG